MKWTGRRASGNVDDQRGNSSGGLPRGILTKGGLGTIAIIFLISWLTGTNPLTLLQETDLSNGPVQGQSTSVAISPEEDELANFVSVVLASTEDVWHKQMSDYREPVLVLFRSQIESGCGSATSSSGPFYCSADEKLYIDLSFYEELKNNLDAPGDFAQAYVIAHEVGHHVQHLLGITDKVHAMRNELSEVEYNQLSVKLELQADFLAGVWAHHARDNQGFIEPDDIEEAIRAASSIGDDHLQKQFQGTVVPDSFTHGTSAQRVKWFTKGFQTGDPDQGDTFTSSSL
jgi:predicted metalloprotease